MAYLVRKITRAKWEPGEDLARDEIPADAVTADLRTNGNVLSFWQLDMPSKDSEICRIALALATAAERVDRMDLTWIDKNRLSGQGITLKPSPGRTPVESLRGNHVDVTKLDLDRLCRIAGWIADALARQQHKRFTKRELVFLIVEAVREGIVSLDDLAPKVKEEIGKKLGN